MKNKQLLQELVSWQWDISGFQKAAFLIEERLDIIHKNEASVPAKSRMNVDNLQNRIIREEKELDDLERILVQQKESLRAPVKSQEWQTRIEKQQQVIRDRFNTDKTAFVSLKNEYRKVLSDMLLKIAS